MTSKLKRVIPICLVVIFFIVALIAEHIPVSMADQLLTPKVTFTDQGDGTFLLVGLDNTMEYNLIKADYTGDWTLGSVNTKIEGEQTVFIKYKYYPSDVQILPLRHNYAITLVWTGGSVQARPL